MSDLFQLQSTAPKIFGSVLLSALVSYFGWKTLEKVLFEDSNKMFRWFSSSPPKLLQDPEIKYEVPLISREEVSHDTRKFKFGLPSEKHVLGLPIGQHVHLTTKVDGQLVIRPYTPTSSDDDQGYFELVIKVYFKNVHPKFPDGGKMTQYLNDMKIGDTIQVRGPSGRLEYGGKGNFAIRPDKKAPAAKKNYKKVSMVAGGTGIAPMLQIIRDILKKSNQDKTEIALLFANQTEKDILLRDELEDLLARHPGQFKLWYTIDRPEEGWKYSSGFVNKDLIKEYLHEPSPDTIILMCGPPPMIKFVQSQLDELDYPKEHRFQY